MMDTKHMCFLCVAGILFSATAGQQPLPRDVKISVDISRSHTHEGHNITVTCRVNDLGSGFIYFYKTIIDTTHGDLVELISTDDSLIPPYLAFGRYHVHRYEVEHTTLFIMDIHGVKPEDSGHLGCSLGDISQNIFDITQFTVYRNPKSVMFANYTETNSISVVENEGTTLECHVAESIPVPEVHVTIGEHDVTSDFQSHPSMNVHCQGGGVRKNCSLHSSYDVIATRDNFVATYMDHGKDVTCRAIITGSELPEVSATLPLHVEYSPKFQCPGEAHAFVGERNKKIACVVNANPHNDSSVYVWTFRQGSSDVSFKVLATGVGHSQGNYHTGSTRLSDEEVEVILALGQVSEDSFKDYTLYAGNHLGNSSMTIELKKGMAGEESGGGASRPGHVTANVMLSVVTFLFLCAFVH